MPFETILLGITLVLLLSLAVGNSTVDRKIARAERRMVDVERKLDAVLDHLGVRLPEPEHPEVRALLAQGKKIQAIKAYRDATGADLKSAKDAVEQLEVS